MSIDLETLTIEKAHKSLVEGVFSVWDLCQAYLSNIEKRNIELNVYLEVFDDIKSQAEEAQKRFTNGRATLLTGIPFALKDNILIKGKKVTAGSKILQKYSGTYDATVTTLLKNAGAIIIGRTNMDEFAMGSSTENSAYGPTKNPIDPSCVPGGSSGGSAAAVASNMALVALGSDTGGSIRQPAAFCGLVGLKPTYNTISRFGLIAMASSLDQIGPLTKTVADAEIIYNTIASYDPLDSTSSPENVRNKEGAPKKKIGVPESFLSGEGIDPEVKENFIQSLEKFKALGYEIVTIDLPLLSYSLPVYYILMPAEASANLARFDGMRYGTRIDGTNLYDTYLKSRGQGFGREVRRRILLGTYVLSHGYYDAYYNKAIQVQQKIKQELNDIFQEVDVILTPTTPTPAFRFGEKTSDPVSMYLSDIFTVPANITGNPALSLPSGHTASGLPLGIQCMADHYNESVLFRIGKEFEQSKS